MQAEPLTLVDWDRQVECFHRDCKGQYLTRFVPDVKGFVHSLLLMGTRNRLEVCIYVKGKAIIE